MEFLAHPVRSGGREAAYSHILCNVVDFIRPAPDPLERGAGTLRFFPFIYRGLRLGRAVRRHPLVVAGS